MMRKKLLIFLIDAFAYDYFKKTNFLRDLCDQSTNLKTLLAYSSGILPAIWSGTYPEENGIWTEFYLSKSFKRKPKSFARYIPESRIHTLLKYFVLRYLKGGMTVTSVGIPEFLESFFVRNEIDYSRFPPVTLKNLKTLDQYLHDQKIPFHYEFHGRKIDRDSLFSALKQLKQNTNVFIYYIGELDALGHKHGPDIKALQETIELIGETIRQAYFELAKNYETDLLVFSDHGMTKLIKWVDLMEILSSYQIGKDYLAFYDSTFARFWFWKDRIKDEIMDILRGLKEGRVLDPDDLCSYHIKFADFRYGETIFLMNCGTEIYPSFMEPKLFCSSMRRGMHGYSPEEPSTEGIFLVKSDVDVIGSQKMDVTDILDKILELLGIARS
jgi:hypothetical protein